MEKNTIDIRKNLRINAKNTRNSLSDFTIKELSSSISKNILDLLHDKFPKVNSFLCYYPLEKEVDLLPLYEVLLKNNASLFFPKTFDNCQMNFYKINDLDNDFICGNFGVFEPKNISNENMFSDEKNVSQCICFTPGLLFDFSLNRLGYGMGYYDRYFEKYKGLTKIGRGYNLSLIDSIPISSFDVPLDFVITEDRILSN